MRRFGLVVLGALACANGPAGGQVVSTIADRHDFETRSGRADLPGRLDEVSGLAFTSDGRLFAHDDERGRIHEIDPESGETGKRFELQDDIRDDFEGITIVGGRFFLISSAGILYEFREAEDDASTPFRRTDTRLGAGCEVEGLDYDPEVDALLIACKVVTPERGELVVARIPLDPSAPTLQPIRVPRDQLVAHGLDEDFAPSAIAVDPTGTLVLLSAQTESVVEVQRDGTVVAGVRLSKGRHPQPEGVAFGPDGTLYIADEKNDDDARLTMYARRTVPGPHP